MKKSLLTTAVLAAMVGGSSLVSASSIPEGVVVEPIISVSTQAQTFLDEYSIFADAYRVGGQPITRVEAANIFVDYVSATKGDRIFNNRMNCDYYTDISALSASDQDAIKKACAAGLFRGHEGKFSPNDNLTWAQTLTVLDRIAENTTAETNPWWNGYAQNALKKGFIKATDLIKMDWNITSEQFVQLLADFHYANEGTVTTPNLEGVTWTLTKYNEEVVEGEYKLTFTDGKVTTKFCNSLFGNYSTSGDQLSGLLAGTKMACLETEPQTLENNFSIDGARFVITSTRMVDNNIERLTITTKEGNTYLWVKNTEEIVGGDRDEHGCIGSAGYSWNETTQACERPRERDVLAGKEFGLRTINGTAVNGTYLISFAEGRFSTQFCNVINGDYNIEGEKITGTAISTLMACTDAERNDLEAKFDISGGTIKVEGDIFTLTTRGGDVFGFHAIYRGG